MRNTKAVDEYGRFKVTRARKNGVANHSTYYVEVSGEEPVAVGTGKDAKTNARTLAATLNAAGVFDFDVLPPGLEGDDPSFPKKHSDDEWESWVSDSQAVPVRIATAGKAAVAGWCKVVLREREKWMGNRLGVSESTVRQYLSDLREGRR